MNRNSWRDQPRLRGNFCRKVNRQSPDGHVGYTIGYDEVVWDITAMRVACEHRKPALYAVPKFFERYWVAPTMEEYIRNADLSKPILILKGFGLLDGSFRLIRAGQLGISKLPAIMMWPEEAEEFECGKFYFRDVLRELGRQWIMENKQGDELCDF